MIGTSSLARYCLVAITIFVSACRPTAHEQWLKEQERRLEIRRQAEEERERAQRRAWEEEIARTRQECPQARPGFVAQAWAACHDRLREVDRKYGMPPDPFNEASWAYRIAVAQRADRGELTPEQANALLAQFNVYLEAQRADLQAQRVQQLLGAMGAMAAMRAATAAEIAAYEQAWSRIWEKSSSIWEGLGPRQPRIQCRTSWDPGWRAFRTDCK